MLMIDYPAARLTEVLGRPYTAGMVIAAYPLRLVGLLVCLLPGCRLAAPIHVWQSPLIESTVDKQVVVSSVAGPEDVAGVVRQKLLRMAPRDLGRSTQLIDYQDLQPRSEIRLVSATDHEPSDLALASVGRDIGADYLLRGELLRRRESRLDDESGGVADIDSVTISWCMTSLKDGNHGGGLPITVNTKLAIENYPDLAFLGDVDEILTTAAVRESFRLMVPSIRRERIEIENAYFLPGSREIRRGNILASTGQWGEAERIWSSVLSKYPFQIPAMHNMALAAAAAQDFSRAKQLARRAIRLHPSKLHQSSLVWIETRQRDYHKSFDLPDPPEGWFLTKDRETLTEDREISTNQFDPSRIP